MSQEIPIHPAALLFPMMSNEELGTLADDIAANGLIEPVVLYHGQILDGRNRLAACELASVEPRFIEVEGDLSSPVIYVVSKNVHRRHLTTNQRAVIATEMVPMLQEEAKKRQVSGLKNQEHSSLAPIGANERTWSSGIAAKAMQVGRRTVERVIKVKKNSPELYEQIKRDEITPTAAARQLPREPKPKNIVSGETKSTGRKAKEPRKTSRRDKNTPYKPETPRQQKQAGNQRHNMIAGLSNITGLCRGLVDELDLPMALSVCSEEDKKMVTGRARESAKNLRAFISKVERTKNA